MDEQSATPATEVAQDMPETAPVADTVAAPPDEAPQQPETPDVSPEASVAEVDDDFEYPNYEIPQAQPIDFSNLQVGEDNLIDPNALAGNINQALAAAEERATMRAQQAYQEQRAEEKQWEKAYATHPELKTNKELRDLVHRARLGEVADMLSRTNDPSSVKLPTPTQIADRFFKHVSTAKAEGMKQATENTVIQASAHVSSGGTRTDDSSDARSRLYKNINNPNKEVARQARSELLKGLVFGNE